MGTVYDGSLATGGFGGQSVHWTGRLASGSAASELGGVGSGGLSVADALRVGDQEAKVLDGQCGDVLHLLVGRGPEVRIEVGEPVGEGHGSLSCVPLL